MMVCAQAFRSRRLRLREWIADPRARENRINSYWTHVKRYYYRLIGGIVKCSLQTDADADADADGSFHQSEKN